MEDGLFLGKCQGYMGLKYHMQDALIENDLDTEIATSNPHIAIFARKYYSDLQKLDDTKKYDFCFIGSIQSAPKVREWVITFAKENFTEKSIFINTDNDPDWKLLGSFDYSHLALGFSPKATNDTQSRDAQYRIISENRFYFETMRKSLYVLCPAGDSAWSFRFYETLMCKSIPVVITWHNTYRTKEESNLQYIYVNLNHTEAARKNEYHVLPRKSSENLTDKYKLISTTLPRTIPNYNDCVSHNTKVFKTFHMYNKSYE
jgi:hypothetical protein